VISIPGLRSRDPGLGSGITFLGSGFTGLQSEITGLGPDQCSQAFTLFHALSVIEEQRPGPAYLRTLRKLKTLILLKNGYLTLYFITDQIIPEPYYYNYTC